MGNLTSSSITPVDTTGFTQICSNIDSPFYGQVSVWRSNNTQQTLALSYQNLYDEQEYIYAIKQCLKQSKFNHQSLIKLYSVQHQKSDILCTSVFQLSLLYEYISYSLMDDILIRQNQQNYYIESEIWYILLSVLSGLSYLKLNQIQNGNIRPNSIFVNYQGYVKIPYKACFSYIQNSYQEASYGQTEQIYLSPELMKNLKSGNLIPQQDIYKSDIFTLALSVLECCLLTNLQDLNDMINFQINYQPIEQALSSISNRYSENLIKFLSIMLEFDEYKRCDSIQLCNYMEELSIAQFINISDKLFSLKTQQNYVPSTIPYQKNDESLEIIKRNSKQREYLQSNESQNQIPVDLNPTLSVQYTDPLEETINNSQFPYKNGDLIDGRYKITRIDTRIKKITVPEKKSPIKFVYKSSDLHKLQYL